MSTVEVMTDAGSGFLKALGNAQGEHALACELLGSSMAEWLGLPTLDFALIEVADDDVIFLDDDEATPLASRRRAKPGPAFISRGIRAVSWSDDPNDFSALENPEVIAGLVVIDTWICNPDRHPRRPPDPTLSTWANRNLDNVLLEILPRNRRRLVAMDFSVCLHCRGGGLRNNYDARLVRDDGVYGLFGNFEPFVTMARLLPFLERLGNRDSLDQHLVEALDRIPSEWKVDRESREAVRRFLSARAAYLVDNFVGDLRRTFPRLSD